MLHDIFELPHDSRSQHDLLCLFGYLFGAVTQKQFVDDVADPKRANSILSTVKSSGYVAKDCKMYAYARYAGMRPTCADFNIDRSDARILAKVEPRHISVRKYPAFTIEQFDAVLSELYSSREMRDYIGKLMHKKMKFLVQSFGLSYDHISGDLFTAAVWALLKAYPRYKSHLHFKNIAKTTISNTAKTMITSHTTAKRQRLVRNTDGTFSSYMGSMQEAEYVAAPDDSERICVLQSLAQLEARCTPRVKTFLHCMAGLHDDGFSEWLGKPNDDFVSHVGYDVYRRQLEKFLGVTREQSDSLFERMRAHL